MFLGTHSVLIDEKGRLAVPARFRPELKKSCEGRMVLNATPQGIKLYPAPVFERLVQASLAKIADVQERKTFLRRFVGDSLEVEIDDAGRFVVPPAVRAQLGRDVVLIAMTDKFELHAAAQWEAYKAESQATYAQLLDGLDL